MSELATFGLGAASILSGLLVGLYAPVLASRQARRAAATDEQRALANQILSMWEDKPDLVKTLARPTSVERRTLLLLGMRLADPTARDACLDLASVADSEPLDEDQLLEAWVAMVAAVAVVYRASV